MISHKSRALSKANFIYFRFPLGLLKTGNPNLELQSFVGTAVFEAREQALSWKAESSCVSIRHRRPLGPELGFLGLSCVLQRTCLSGIPAFSIVTLKPQLVSD